jgi:hypothetical protein
VASGILPISVPPPTCELLDSNSTFLLSTNLNYPHKTAENPFFLISFSYILSMG